MGRAMLIIVSGVMVAMGSWNISSMNQAGMLTKSNAGYAEFVNAKNTAHMAIQMAMQKMNDDSTWASTHDADNPWMGSINGNSFLLYTEYIHDSPDFWSPDTVRLYSTSQLENSSLPVEIVSVYEINSFDYIPDFKSPLTIATTNFSYSSGGSSSINGFDDSGTGCTDKPGITVMDSYSKALIENHTANDLTGDPPVKTDSLLSYQPTDDLIKRLEGMEYTKNISGTYKGDLGTKNNPGVFFVEDQARLTGGISEGYGILVIRSGGEMAYEDSSGVELDVAGNFEFNGLVIFENAYDFDGTGTPTIRGSALVGNTPTFDRIIDINISGNLSLQYDCTAKSYAQKAAALAVKQNKYKLVATFD
ncbi:hypothetical protein G3570_03100 [Balneolaceae bacterium YR4-1]|uniref:Type 4 fimbrial biogenesis protein PilX N-terminal domain-containing protein n=1 Tax=Halalkalibaculum roseum TaxID=2709311 RepID=A0A6M1SX08_9BACT|nr:hypothetical protein [Halalkalibaculum roseum]NGP75604.1 hypothetical protein [Halalkalibaculum roseum]